MTAYPFGGGIQIREYTGKQLWQALEHGLAGKKRDRAASFAGCRFALCGRRQPLRGQAAGSVYIRDKEGRESPLEPQARYAVVLGEYLVRGGDGFQMLKAGKLRATCSQKEQEVVEDYIRRHSPLPPPEAGRVCLEQKR